MKKHFKQKVLTYIQSGSLISLRNYIISHEKKKKAYDLNFKSGPLNRTPLHLACGFGDDAIVRCLLKYGADANVKDKNKDLPLHVAAEYLANSGNYCDYKILIEPLIRDFPDGMNHANKTGDTPSDLLKQARKMQNLNNSQQENSTDGDDNDESGSDDEQTSTELSWNEKLVNAQEGDFADSGVNNEFSDESAWAVPDLPTFEQWADRIAEEYKRKQNYQKIKHHAPGQKFKITHKQTAHKRHDIEADNYRRRMEQKKAELMETKHQKYQQGIAELKSKTDGGKKLRFTDIPWPCLGTVKEMVEVILMGEPKNPGKRRKFILKQLMLWHPDKFAQRCNNIICDDDRESILDTVKLLSQSLNTLLNPTEDTGLI